MDEREGRVVKAIEETGVSVDKVHRIWTEDDVDGVDCDVVLFVTPTKGAMTARIWPTGEVVVDNGW
ncbi:MAG: hypothetical protein M3M99_07155 [Actinomycetota bacterium]|nr:hypothetical protein [Actinomycetota bacterium]